MACVQEVKVKQGYVVTVTFQDGRRCDIDFERFLTGRLFGELRSEDRFREVAVSEGGGVEWPNGADICPDVLYYDLPLAGETPTPEAALRLKRFLETPEPFDDGTTAVTQQRRPMRGLSEFMGMTIEMHFEPDATPCFQVHYGEIQAKFAIDSLHQLRGRLGPVGVELVQEWAALHREELVANWNRARQGHPLIPIEPLE